MGKLTYEELILLDNFIYLEWQANENDRLINVIDILLSGEELNRAINKMGNCIINISKNEWINILKLIKDKKNLAELIIKNINASDIGVKSVCFIDDEENTTVIFRGTMTINEWEDNGQGAYEYDTNEQIEALNYINKLKYNNITVSGHSKGGNKAQYVTILSSKIERCISINGQGFSNEFIKKYTQKISENKSKITSISSKYDYVNCLFNCISNETHYIETDFQINPLFYHKANILIDKNGELRTETEESKFSKIIRNFSLAVISDFPEDIKYFIIDLFIDTIEMIFCKNENKVEFFRAVSEKMIMYYVNNSHKKIEKFNLTFALMQVLSLPLLFWKDIINVEELKSKELFEKVISNIKLLSSNIIKKVETLNKDSFNLISNNINELIYNLEIEANNQI